LNLKKELAKKRPAPVLPWESDFALISPSEFTAWIRELRFQVDEGYAKRFQPVRLSQAMIMQIATRSFAVTEWKELQSAMPTGEPFAYLVLEDSDGRQVFSLHNDKSVIGRSPDCDVVIPERFITVSKQHCKITRGISTITIEDLGSINGTYVKGELLKDTHKALPLAHNTSIILG